MISIQYTPTFPELRDACVLFIEQKPLLRFMVRTFNFMGYLLLFSYILKAYAMGLSAHEYGMIALILAWVFGRARLNRYLVSYRLKHHPLIGHPLRLTISSNDLSWKAGASEGHEQWSNLKRVLVTNNGYVFSTKRNQYLWIPLQSLTASAQKTIAQYFEKYGIKRIRVRQSIGKGS